MILETGDGVRRSLPRPHLSVSYSAMAPLGPWDLQRPLMVGGCLKLTFLYYGKTLLARSCIRGMWTPFRHGSILYEIWRHQ